MAKTDITFEQAQVVVDRVSKELGLLVKETSGFLKVEGPTNKHRVYIQKSRTLNRIDFTVDLPPTLEDGTENPMYRQLSAPNGSIKCHIAPTLEHLEAGLRMLGDGNLETQVPNKPRPFAATKAPARRPKPVAMPVPEAALIPVIDGEVLSLEDRLARIKERARKGRIGRILDNPEQYGAMSYDEAAAIVDGKVQQADVTEAARNSELTEVAETLAEAGIEVA